MEKLGKESVDNYQAELLKGASAEATVLFDTMGKILLAWRDFESEISKSNINLLLEKWKEADNNSKEKKKSNLFMPIIFIVIAIIATYFTFKGGLRGF